MYYKSRQKHFPISVMSSLHPFSSATQRRSGKLLPPRQLCRSLLDVVFSYAVCVPKCRVRNLFKSCCQMAKRLVWQFYDKQLNINELGVLKSSKYVLFVKTFEMNQEIHCSLLLSKQLPCHSNFCSLLDTDIFN